VNCSGYPNPGTGLIIFHDFASTCGLGGGVYTRSSLLAGSYNHKFFHENHRFFKNFEIPKPNDTFIFIFIQRIITENYHFKLLKKPKIDDSLKIQNNCTTLVDTQPNNDLNLPSRTAPLHNGAAARLSALIVREKTYMNGCQLVFIWSPTF
jgi:hypothetical protein